MMIVTDTTVVIDDITYSTDAQDTEAKLISNDAHVLAASMNELTKAINGLSLKLR